MRNLPDVQQIGDSPGLLDGLPLDALAALVDDAEAQNRRISAAKRAITARILEANSGAIAAARRAKASDFGTVRVPVGEFVLIVDTPKRVDWDQAKLDDAGLVISKSGERPGDFIKLTLSVDERTYLAAPTFVRAALDAARTTKPGPTTVKIERV